MTSGSTIIERIAEVLRKTIGRKARITIRSSGVSCILPDNRALIIVVSARLMTWDSVPADISESFEILTDTDCQKALSVLERQVKGWGVQAPPPG